MFYNYHILHICQTFEDLDFSKGYNLKYWPESVFNIARELEKMIQRVEYVGGNEVYVWFGGKVCQSKNETILLSTHLIEEVSEFIGRAILIRKGEIVADVSMMEVEEQGENLMSYIKKAYHYKADRIAQAIRDLESE